MVKFPWSSKAEEISIKSLDSNAGFLLNLDGHKVIALRLPSEVAMELSGQELLESVGFLSKLKAKLGLGSVAETEHWLMVTNVDNPLLDEHDKLEALVAQELTNATGTAVNKSDLAISASVPINGDETPPQVVRHEESPPTPTAQRAQAVSN
jgi:hypothetical protein